MEDFKDWVPGMEKGTAGMEKGMEKEKGNHQVMTWKATLMGIRIRDPNYEC